MDRLELGRAAEHVAREYLAEQGLTLLCTNYRCRLGELDVVALENGILVIAEVRLRSDKRFGGAGESIDWSKRRRIVRATQHLLMRRPELRRYPVRFDVVTFDAGNASGSAVRWTRGAFS